MSIAPINGIQAIVVPKGPTPPTGTGGAGATQAGEKSFSSTVRDALEAVSDAEHQADAIAVDIASGGNSGVHDLMIATAKASLSVDLLVQTRNRALEAYQEIMRMQV